jgi:predicted O-methyltransferase YrrM
MVCHRCISLHIAAALGGRPRAQHIIVDPFQSTDWHGIGVANLDRAGVDLYELREEPSELVLPQLLRDGVEFDLVFIDGLHTFDQTFLDLYYANRLIKRGGYIIIDDATWPAVSKGYFAFRGLPVLQTGRRHIGPHTQVEPLVRQAFKAAGRDVVPAVAL